jgi:hypothetical protein
MFLLNIGISKLVSLILILEIATGIGCIEFDYDQVSEDKKLPQLSEDYKLQMRSFSEQKADVENYKVISKLFLKYNDLLRSNGILNSSQRVTVLRNYNIIKGAIKNFVHENPNNGKLVLQYMAGQFEKQEPGNYKQLLEERLPFKWGR